MGDVSLVAVVPPELLDSFLADKKLEGVDGMPSLSSFVKEGLRRYIQRKVGYDGNPIACLSNYNGTPPELSKVWKHMDEVLTVRTGSSLWELRMPEDMLVSVDLQDLLTISEETQGMDYDDEDADLYIEDLESILKVGYKEGQETVSFIPFLDLKKCRVGMVLAEGWSANKLAIPGIRFLDLKTLNVF